MKPPPSFPDRRQFLKTGGALAAGLLSHEAQAATNQLPALPANPRTQASMPTRNLGKTGYKVGIFSLGGQSAIEQPNNFKVAVPLIERALDLGVNFIDTTPRSPRAVERAIHRTRHATPPQRGLPCHQD